MLMSGRPEASGSENIGSALKSDVVLLLAVCTLALKPSAAPNCDRGRAFLLVQFLVEVERSAGSGRDCQLDCGADFCGEYYVFRLPGVSESTVVHGCPWGVGKAAAQVITTDIEDWGRWRDTAGPSEYARCGVDRVLDLTTRQAGADFVLRSLSSRFCGNSRLACS